MALQKTFILPEGVSANYIKYDGIAKKSRKEKYIVIMFDLYLSAAAAAAGRTPIRDSWVKLRLSQAKYEEYFGNTVLESEGFIVQAYVAAKAERVLVYDGTVTLEDAVDV